MEDLSGRQFGPYQIVGPLGEGGMAAVYRAYQPGMDRYVAIKILPRQYANDPNYIKRFKQEALTIAKLEHMNILPVHDFGEEDGYTYLVMRFVETGTLADLLRGDPLPMGQIVQIISQIGKALDYAHSKDVIHRDVKPSNVLMDADGNCMLTDFGISKILTSTAQLTGPNDRIGTPAYMSPEQGSGMTLDGRSDIYSLGIILYQMITGHLPYNAETPMAILNKHIYDPLPLPTKINPGVSEAVERVILKALAKDRKYRFDTAEEMVNALEAASSHVEIFADKIRFPSIEKTIKVTQLKNGLETAISKENWGEAGDLLKQLESLGSEGADVAGKYKKQFPKAKKRFIMWGLGGTLAVIIIGIVVTLLFPPVGEYLDDVFKGTPPTATKEPTITAIPATHTPAPSPTTWSIGSTKVSPIDDMVMVFVPAGEFMMGSTRADPYAQANEFPQHAVYLDSYWIDQTEVTNKQYLKCVQENACNKPDYRSNTKFYYFDNIEYQNYPVINVTKNDADAYCAWAGRRLPTEAEWEKAARGDDQRIYPWGNVVSLSLANYAGKEESNLNDTTFVGKYPKGASFYGVLDMAGNVWEWVSDAGDPNYYAVSPHENPTGPDLGLFYVLRGGSFAVSEKDIRAASRRWLAETYFSNSIGFRCAADP